MVEILRPLRGTAGQGARKRARPVHQGGDRLLYALSRAFLEAGRAIDEVRDRADGNTGGSCDIGNSRAFALQRRDPIEAFQTLAVDMRSLNGIIF